MVTRFVMSVSLAALLALLSGCVGTGGGNQFQNTVYDTHRRVANLDKNLQASVTQLNETTSGLVSRLDESDQQMRGVQGALQENQAKLNGLEQKLDALTNTIYRDQGRTLLPGAPSAGMLPAPSAAPVASVPAVAAVAPDAAQGVAPGAAPGAVAGLPAEQPPLEPVPVVAPPPVEPAAADAAATTGSQDTDYQQAQKSYARQDYAAALDQFGAFLQRYPLSQNAQNAQFWRAKSFQAVERYEDAIGEYNKLRDAYPVSAGANAANSKVPYAMHQQAVCHARLGQTERAIDLLQQVIRDFPTSPAADQAKSDLKRLQP